MKFFSRIRPTASLLVILAAGLLLTPRALFAQATGNVTGIVKDSTGAVIPNATITLTDQSTGVAHTTTSNSQGAFALAGVIPGLSYQLSVSATNFESWQSQPFPVRAGDFLSYDDQIRLKVGSATAAVTVQGQVDTNLEALDTGERSDIITAKDLNTLSIVGRDASELVKMLPGFAMSTGNQGLFNRPGFNTAVQGLSGPTGAYVANGSGPTGIAVVSDGVSLTDIATNSGSVQEMNIEMVSEVKASNSSYGAQYAKGPALIQSSTKTGGSAFHGEGYFVGRDAVLNSNDWYDNFLRQSRPDGRYLYPGAQIGGPVLLPRLFPDFNHNRDKLFFFAAFEYFNQIFEADQQAISAWVPTMAERQGDFSEASLDAELCGARPDGAPNPNAIQPMCFTDSFLPNGTQVVNNNAQPYANGAGAALVNWFPKPNADPFTNPFGYNYIQQLQQTQNGEIFRATLQYNINPNSNLFLVYGLQKEVDEDPVDMNSFPTGSVPYPGNVSTGDVSNVLAARYTRFFGATVTNDFDAAMSFVSLPGKLGNPGGVYRFGIPGNGGLGFNYLGMYKNNYDYAVPAIGSGGGNGYPNLLMPGGFYTNRVHTKKVDPILQDNVSWQVKNHFFQFGGYWETGTYNGIADAGAYPQGQYTFNVTNAYFEYSSTNQAPYSGCVNPNPSGNLRNSGAAYLGSCYNPTALMYEGYADSFTQTNFTPIVDMRYLTMAGFAMDTVKLHNLTLILGARFEHLGPWRDVKNNGLATFSDSLYTQQCGGYTRNCGGANPGITWSSQKTGVSNSVNSPPSLYFTPRVGASWDVFGKGNTVLRGGWGMYRNEEQFNPYALAAATAQGYKTSFLQGALTFNQIDSQTPVFPTDFNAYVISPHDTVRPIYYEFNGGIDQSIPRVGFLHMGPSHLSVAYVGNHSVNLGSYSNSNSYNSGSDINIICGIETGCPANKNPAMQGAQDNLFFALYSFIPPDLTALYGNPVIDGIGGLGTPEYDVFRPYPFYQHVYQLNHTFYSNYSSAQIEWDRSGGGMVTWGANYTFAKNLATGASWNNQLVDPVNLRNDYNPVPYDRTQTFNIHYLIDLGNRFKGNRLFGEALNGWQVSGISQAMSGFPLPSENGLNFGFGFGNFANAVQVPYPNQANQQAASQCQSLYGIQPDKNGNTFCVSYMNPVVWLGTPDVLLMPTLVKGVNAKGSARHQFVNPQAFGIPQPGSNGAYRLPYLRGPAFLEHDVTVLKNFPAGEGKNLQLRMAAFNVFNHPLVSFNNNDTTNLTLGYQDGIVGQALKQNMLQYQDFGIANIKVGSRLVELEAKYTF